MRRGVVGVLVFLSLMACGPGESSPPCIPALPDAEPCGASCVVDDDCADSPGTWCDPIRCRDEHACEVGRCNLTLVQGESCPRDGACVSGHCENGVCAPEPL